MRKTWIDVPRRFVVVINVERAAVLVVSRLPSDRKRERVVGEEVEQRDQIAVVLVALEAGGIPPELGQELAQRGAAVVQLLRFRFVVQQREEIRAGHKLQRWRTEHVR